MLKAILTILTLLLSFETASGADVTLVWDPVSPTPDGYRLYHRTEGKSYDYTHPIWYGQETSYVVAGLYDAHNHYFVVRAYVGTDESVDSNEVTFISVGSGTDGTGTGDETTDDQIITDDEPDDGDESEVDAPTSLEIQKITSQLTRIETDIEIILKVVEAIQTALIDHPVIEAAPFCGNPDSMVVHKRDHWCGSNAATFQSMYDAMAAGYRACGVCKPE